VIFAAGGGVGERGDGPPAPSYLGAPRRPKQAPAAFECVRVETHGHDAYSVAERAFRMHRTA
jgi:hypothetical protein